MRPRVRTRAGLVALLLAAGGCGDTVTAPSVGDELTLSFRNLSTVHPDQGTLEVWVHTASDTVSVGRLPGSGAAADAGAPVPDLDFELPLAGATGIFVTVEPPGDANARPSRSVVLAGPISGGRADLVLEGSITDGRPLQPAPGAHSLFTTSNNAEDGYPSAEAAGLWLFTLTPSRNVHRSREVRVTPLQPGWTYEGWIVSQTEPRVWISYGKFRPDELGLLSSRDDTGTGPFSGAQDFRNAGVEDVPGEEWTSTEVSDRLGLTLPASLDVPLLIDGVDASGKALWHHVITVEPAFDIDEPLMSGRPFPVQPYENPVGSAGPGVPRTIELAADRLPSAQLSPRPTIGAMQSPAIP